MKNVDEFFNDLNRNIKEAKTRKALMLFARRGKHYVKSLNIPMIDKSIKNKANKQLKNSLKLIKIRFKHIK